MNVQAIQYVPSANLTLSIARKRFHRNFQQQQKKVENAADDDDTSKQITMMQELWSVHDEVLRYIGEVLRREEKHDHLQNSNFYPYEEDLTVAQLLTRSTVFADAEKYQVVEEWPCEPFSKVVWAKDFRCGKFWLYTDMFLAVEYLKTIDAFQQLSLSEKVELVKSTAICSCTVSASFYSLKQRADCVVYPDGSLPFNARSAESLSEMERKIRIGLVVEMSALQLDQIQLALLHAIVVLNDVCEKLSAVSREHLAAARQKYARVLLHYLRNRHGEAVGVRRFSETLSFMSTLARYARFRQSYFAYRRYVLRLSCPAALFRECMNDSNDDDQILLSQATVAAVSQKRVI